MAKAYSKARRAPWEKKYCPRWVISMLFSLPSPGFPQKSHAVGDLGFRAEIKLRTRSLLVIGDPVVLFLNHIKSDEPVSRLNTNSGDYMLPMKIPPQVWLDVGTGSPYLLRNLHSFYRRGTAKAESKLREDSVQMYWKPKSFWQMPISKKCIWTLYQAGFSLQKLVRNLEVCVHFVACLVICPITIYIQSPKFC